MEDGDYEGACSRAYYAMFHAASLIEAAVGTGDATSYKTHSGLIAAFHRTLVLPGIIDREHGRALSRASGMRSFADYADVPCQKHDAAIMIEQASAFLDAVLRHLYTRASHVLL